MLSVNRLRTTVLLAAIALFLTSASPAKGQGSNTTVNPSFQRLVDMLQTEIDLKDATIRDQNVIIDDLEEQIATLEQLAVKLEAKSNEQEWQIVLHKGIVDDQKKLLLNYQSRIAVYDASISDRDEVLKELAKSRKTSTWQKVAESITPVASVVALAIAGGK